jgi:hypothetical protein
MRKFLIQAAVAAFLLAAGYLLSLIGAPLVGIGLMVGSIAVLGGILILDFVHKRGPFKSSNGGRTGATPPGTTAIPDKPLSSAAATPLIKAKGTNATNFPRIESAVDSFGHAARRTASGNLLVGATDEVLRPGQQVTFNVEASDPNGEDLRLELLRSGGGTVDVTIGDDGTIVWNVNEQDIADPAHMHIYLTSQRTYHKVRTWDDAVTFTYRVLPRA